MRTPSWTRAAVALHPRHGAAARAPARRIARGRRRAARGAARAHARASSSRITSRYSRSMPPPCDVRPRLGPLVDEHLGRRALSRPRRSEGRGGTPAGAMRRRAATRRPSTPRAPRRACPRPWRLAREASHSMQPRRAERRVEVRGLPVGRDAAPALARPHRAQRHRRAARAADRPAGACRRRTAGAGERHARRGRVPQKARGRPRSRGPASSARYLRSVSASSSAAGAAGGGGSLAGSADRCSRGRGTPRGGCAPCGPACRSGRAGCVEPKPTAWRRPLSIARLDEVVDARPARGPATASCCRTSARPRCPCCPRPTAS